jgi:hypothetical protein
VTSCRRAAASKPFARGIEKSRTINSGFSPPLFSIPSTPSDASPQTSDSGRHSMKRRNSSPRLFYSRYLPTSALPVPLQPFVP